MNEYPKVKNIQGVIRKLLWVSGHCDKFTFIIYEDVTVDSVYHHLGICFQPCSAIYIYLNATSSPSKCKKLLQKWHIVQQETVCPYFQLLECIRVEGTGSQCRMYDVTLRKLRVNSGLGSRQETNFSVSAWKGCWAAVNYAQELYGAGLWA